MKNAFRSRPLALALCLAPLALFPGCLATTRGVLDLKDDSYQMQLKLAEVQRNQADLSSKLDTLNATLEALNAQLSDTHSRMSLQGQRLDDVESNLAQRMSKLSDQLTGTALRSGPTPSEMYRIAYNDFSAGKYDLAVAGFRSYLEKFPQGELAAQAQYYAGECLFSKSDWANAYFEFVAAEKNYPRNDVSASARLKQALCLEQMGRLKDARGVFESIGKDFPGTPEAFTAQEKLNAGGR